MNYTIEEQYQLGGDKCSKCGGVVQHRFLLSNPPQDQWECTKCGARKTESIPNPSATTINFN